MDRAWRTSLRRAVVECRDLLVADIRRQLEGKYGIRRDSVIDPLEALPHLGARGCRVADMLRQALSHERATHNLDVREAVERLVRETSFSYLNRFVALRSMEARGLLPESVARGRQSAGFRLYCRVAPGALAGRPGEAYRIYLESLFDEVEKEVGLLFDRHAPCSLLFPEAITVDTVLGILADPDLKTSWEQEESLGWAYQYFTPKEERQAAKESPAPRNSYELAIRNQFYTPRYVVRFLVDNTLGRLWYEMRQAQTDLAGRCIYMVRSPQEVFLGPGQAPPPGPTGGAEAAEVWPAYVRHRPKKDPREILVLDPACGSGHFLLYCFDLFEVVYQEAYDDPDLGPTLQANFPDRQEYRRRIPLLILEHNLHGVDIDLRATQIAALALWVRAQRSLLKCGASANRRPRVTRTNIVTAEPMPGNLEDFLSQLRWPELREMAEGIWKLMHLAAEAGSLLAVREEVRSAADRLRSEFALWASTPGSVWSEAESRLLASLRAYAEVVSNGKEYSRKLFVDDAAAGIAFIDVMRKSYDIVLMNPPFGEPTGPSKPYIHQKYPHSKNDMYAAFVDRALQLLNPGGRLGVITSRTGFFLSSFQAWREEVLLKQGDFQVFADLGFGVMDDAMVEAAAYVLERPGEHAATDEPALFIRLLQIDPAEKGKALAEAIASVNAGNLLAHAHVAHLRSFSLIPGVPFAYWVSEGLRRKFRDLPCFEGNVGTVKQGLATADDFRFVRTAWEVSPDSIAGGPFPADWKYPGHGQFREAMLRQLASGKRWTFFAKGGEYSPYYADIHLVVNWQDNGEDIKSWICQRYPYLNGKWEWVAKNPEYYFCPGLTWTYRSVKGFSVRNKPAGTIHGHVGHSAFLSDERLLLPVMAWFNSTCVEGLLRLMTTHKWEVGYVQKLPFPIMDTEAAQILASLASQLLEGIRSQRCSEETDRLFIAPRWLRAEAPSPFAESSLEECGKKVQLMERQVEATVWELYQVDPEDRAALEGTVETSSYRQIFDASEDGSIETTGVSCLDVAGELLSYLVGCAVGRWDVRVVGDASLVARLPGPFDPLPVCPPGMLVGPDGLPAKTGGVASEEWLRARPSAIHLPPERMVKRATIPDEECPLRVAWSGILVDEEGHRDDVVSRARQVLEYLWGDRADSVEREACRILGVADLREYFRSPRGFFDFHIRRYSRSRRKAPIYWYLCSRNRRYGVWLYYHRLKRDTLFAILRDYVETRLEREGRALEELVSRWVEAGGAASGPRELGRRVEEQRELWNEIDEFRKNLLEVARLTAETADGPQEVGYDPDLHDGVLINVAPLWKLVPWPEARKTWEALCVGHYDWSTMARRLWPTRANRVWATGR